MEYSRRGKINEAGHHHPVTLNPLREFFTRSPIMFSRSVLERKRQSRNVADCGGR
jgi:hypothetical protein